MKLSIATKIIAWHSVVQGDIPPFDTQVLVRWKQDGYWHYAVAYNECIGMINMTAISDGINVHAYNSMNVTIEEWAELE